MRRASETWRQHSILLNTVSWRLMDALGLVPIGETRIDADITEHLDRICYLIRLGRSVEASGGAVMRGDDT